MKIWKKPKIKNGIPTKYGWTVWHPENFKLGNNIDIGIGTQIFCQEGVEIQDDVQIGGLCLIYSYNSIDNIKGKVTIRKGARIGAQSLILPGVTIGENAVVGAQSLVKTDIPPNYLTYGTPSKLIREVFPHVRKKMNEIKEKLESFLALESGWHFGEGVPPTKEMISKVLNFLKRVLVQKSLDFEIDVFPGIDGGILLAFYYSQKYLEFIFEVDNSISFSYEGGTKGEDFYEEGLNLELATQRFFSINLIKSEK